MEALASGVEDGASQSSAAKSFDVVGVEGLSANSCPLAEGLGQGAGGSGAVV